MSAQETDSNESFESNNPVHQQMRNDRFRWWMKQLFVCNPFFLVSAALLLLGINRLSVDPEFLGDVDQSKLIFNYSALQLYESLLVGVAIILAKRRIWYDATLLIFLEGLLMFVPFILMTHAGLFNTTFTITLCATGSLLAVLRFAAIRRYIPQINLPPRLLAIGALFWVVNLASPFLFRWVIDNGAMEDWGSYSTITWLVILPILTATGYLLPYSKKHSPSAPHVSWFPLLFVWLWAGASGVRAYCVDYMSDLPFNLAFTIPTVWVMCWTAYKRIADFHPTPLPWVRDTLQVLPAAVTLVAAAAGNVEISFTLAAANVLIYSTISFRGHRSLLTPHLIMISSALLVAYLPNRVLEAVSIELTRADCALATLALIGILQSIRSKLPWVALIGGTMTGVAAMSFTSPSDLNLPFQVMAVFILLHSIRWGDTPGSAASVCRWITAVAWVAHSWIWNRHGQADSLWIVLIASLLLAGSYLIATKMLRWKVSILIPGAAVLSFTSISMHSLIALIRSAPSGLTVIVTSFIFLGIGTVFAMNRQRWNH